MKRSNRVASKRVTFSFQADPGRKIFVAGSFNGWQPDKTRLKDNGKGKYSLALQLPAGRHEYKFVVEDNWCADPQNPEATPNDCGSTNSVIVVE
jgi:1,4-alpha-glucan branching enzyme